MIGFITWVRNFAIQVAIVGAAGIVIGGALVWWVRGLQVQSAEGKIAELTLNLKQAEIDYLNDSLESNSAIITDLGKRNKAIDDLVVDVRRLRQRVSLCDASAPGGGVQVPDPEGTVDEAGNRRTRAADQVLQDLTIRLLERSDKQAEACNALIRKIEAQQ